MASLIEGKAESSARVEIYEDLQCPDSADFRTMMDERLLPKFGQQAAFIHHDFPLPKHNWARRAAVASLFFQASDPKLAITFRQQIMASLRDIDIANFRRWVGKFAADHGIDQAEAIACFDDATLAKTVEADRQEGIARGVSKTPTVFVNGEPFIEHFEFDDIAQAIQRALDAK